MEFCYQTAQIWQLVGKAIYILKILIPIILIVLGMIDFGKAVISSDEKAVSKAAKSLLNRVIAGVCIFFVPTIIGIAFNMVGDFKDLKEDYSICSSCISNPLGKTCTDAAND